jgi:RNA polymerase sigma-70 factor, ECF subfamily
MMVMVSKAVAELDDSELVTLCQNGDQQAFRELIGRYQTRVFNLCYRILGNPDEAEEIAQEVFVKLFKSIGSFRGESKFSTWLYRVTHNVCINQINYLKRRHYFENRSLDLDPKDDSPAPQYASNAPDGEQDLIATELGAAIEEKLGMLAPEMREVIIMRDIEGLSYEEVAQALNVKIGTVKSRLHRGRNELQELLKDYLKDEPV